MSIEAHKCNVDGCKGYIVFDNADFDFKDLQTGASGFYEFDDPTCNECGKQFFVVPHYAVIAEGENGSIEENIESACMSVYEKRRRELGW